MQIIKNYILPIPIANNDNKIEPNKAFKNPSTSNPGAIHPASNNKNAFKTKLNIPRVKIFIGNVIACKKGLIKVLISEMIIHTNIALKKFSTLIPGTIQAVNIIARANKTHLKSMFNIFSPFFNNEFKMIKKH